MNNKNFIKSLSFIFVAILLIALAGCGTNDESTSNDDSDDADNSGDKIVSDEFEGEEIKVLLIGDLENDSSTDPVTGEEVPGLSKVEEEFEARYPGATLNFVTTAWDGYQEKTQAMITSGDADVYQLPGIADYASQGLLEPLESYIEEDDFNLDQYVDGQVDGWKSIGSDDDEPSIYGLPVLGDTRVMVYDEELFDQWGVDYLSDEPTMEEILEKAEALTGKNPETGEENYGVWFRGDFDIAFDAVNTTEGQGGEWGTGYAWDEVDFDFESEEMINSVEWMKDLTEYAPDGFMSDQGDEKWLTEDNDIAMKLFTAPGESIQEAKASGVEDQVGVSDDFSNEEGVGGMFAGSPFSIAENSESKDLAWEFLKFTASDFYQEFNWDAEKIISVTESGAELEKIQESPIAAQAVEFLPDPWTPRYPWASSEPRNIMDSEIESVLTGETDADEAMEKAQKESEEWLERKNE